jgi:ribosome-binding protein aMBF1 (putative translation factor)
MKIKISATFIGKCSVCGKTTKVFSAGDEDSGKVVNVCEDCARKFGETKTSEMIEEFGEENREAFGSGVKIVSNKKQP